MKEPDNEDLSRTVLAFLNRMPTTIRKNILVFVLVYAFDFEPTGSSKLFDELESRIIASHGIKLFAATLRIIGAVDHVLARYVAIEHVNEYRLPRAVERTANNQKLRIMFEKLMLGRELRARHGEVELQSWKVLRNNELSTQSLMDFEDRCLCPPNLK